MKFSEKEILRLLLKSRDRLAAAVWLVVRDHQVAEDIFQNVTIKAMTEKGEFHVEAELLSWAFITARREAIDWARQNKREHLVPSATVVSLMEQEWIASIGETPRGEALRECLKKISGKIASLLKLRYYEGLSCIEIAKKTGAGLDAVYKRLSRAHQSLKNCIELRTKDSIPEKGVHG
ncbi:MAG: sigma-70 family RNA polymerase sigma factor [Planctomycetota bacterium]|nr:sigma-70 family RNA polymerase sigma factor [Planctomycetota bacterium]